MESDQLASVGIAMIGNIVHFGHDVCFRLPVLRSAGFNVAQCSSIERFSLVLDWSPDAVLVAEEPRLLIDKAVSLARLRSTAPLIHFHEPVAASRVDQFDLIIPSLTPPEEWLLRVSTLIEESRILRQQATAIRLGASSLQTESAEVRTVFRERLSRSIRQRTEKIEDPWDM